MALSCRSLADSLAVSTVPITFELNVTYAMPPSKEVDAAWTSLLPQGGGFFNHPKIAPTRSCLAVFHQLHCLDMLRQALYELRPDLVEQGRNLSHSANTHHEDHHATESHPDHDVAIDGNHIHDMYHIGHCYDLLRQSIMCKPVRLQKQLKCCSYDQAQPLIC
jgi:hypothetical protein